MSYKETSFLRGVAIVMIIIHNLIHGVLPYKENEMSYIGERAELFWNNVFSSPFPVFFSSMGWIGVSVFVFLSGYGLTMKYNMIDTNNKIMLNWKWLKSHYIKLLLLMFLPYTMYLLITHISINSFFSFFLVSNLFGLPIMPGCYWYLGMCFQLYFFFFFFHRFLCSTKVLMVLFVIPYIFISFCSNSFVSYLMHNAFGWLPIFVFGCAYPLWEKKSNISISYCLSFFLFLFFLCLFCFLNTYNRFTWQYSHIVGLFALLCLKKFIYLKPIVYIGTVSAYVYVLHPVVRQIYRNITFLYEMNDSLHLFFICLSFVSFCVLFASLLKIVHSKFLFLLKKIYDKFYSWSCTVK